MQNFAALAQQVAISLDVLWRGHISAAADALERIRMIFTLMGRQVLLVICVRFTADNGAVGLGREIDLPRSGAELREYGNSSIDGAADFFINLVPELACQPQAQG